MKINRRHFISTAAAGSIAAALPSVAKGSIIGLQNRYPDYNQLIEIEKKPVLKKELFSSQVIIKTIELLRYGRSFLCRVRSDQGAEGISVAHDGIYSHYLINLSIQRIFVGKDARSLDSLMDQVYITNYRLQGIALGIPAATIEFAILDMLGRISNKPIGMLIGEIHKPRIEFYLATENRGSSADETLRVWQPQIEACKAKEIKIRIGGGHMTNNIDNPPGRTEKLIPLFRKTFGDKMDISADANGSYTVDEAIRIGKILENYSVIRYEEPVPYDYYEETKKVADALKIPVSGGEQDQSFHQLRWMLVNNGLDIIQPDVVKCAGISEMYKIAILGSVYNKLFVPHQTQPTIGTAANLHICSALATANRPQEYTGQNKQLDDIFKEPLIFDNGYIHLPDKQGLGLEIDEEKMKAFSL